SLFFFSLLRPPPTSTLFPYTTLFRSVTLQQGVLRPSNNFRVFRSATFNLLAGRDLYTAHPEQHFDYYKYSPTFALLFANVGLYLDRKSTRLNSSHVAISYAVFCLKKK